MKNFTQLAATVLIYISTLPIYAQMGEIRGKIIDKDNGKTPLPGVNVYVERAGKQMGTFTDDKGNYVIKPLEPGMYKVQMSMMGYQSVVKENVQVTSDQIAFVDASLAEQVIGLPTLVVTDYEAEKPLINKEGCLQILSSKELSNSALMREPKALIATFSDVKLAPNGKDLYIRGARPTSTVYFVDGVKSIDGELNIPGSAMSNIKVYTGGIPARYGDVTGGVVAVETKGYFDVLKEYNLSK